MQVCNAMMTTVKLRAGGAREGGREGRRDLKMVTGGRQPRVRVN